MEVNMIKSIVFCLLFLSCCSVVFAKTFVDNEYELSLDMAKKENKKILLVFTADYCSWCKKLKEVLGKQDVLKELDQYIVCYVDVKNAKNKDLKIKHKIKSLPTCVILNNEEEVLKKDTGFKDERQMIEWLKN